MSHHDGRVINYVLAVRIAAVLMFGLSLQTVVASLHELLYLLQRAVQSHDIAVFLPKQGWALQWTHSLVTRLVAFAALTSACVAFRHSVQIARWRLRKDASHETA